MAALTGMESEIAATETAMTEIVVTGTESAAPGPESVGMGSMNASTCAAIPTSAELSIAAKWILAYRTIRVMAAVRVGGSAADRRQDAMARGAVI
jgi:hypothetical protein